MLFVREKKRREEEEKKRQKKIVEKVEKKERERRVDRFQTNYFQGEIPLFFRLAFRREEFDDWFLNIINKTKPKSNYQRQP